MSKILIVGDVHGRTFWHKAKEIINSVDKVVFLGDYLDPYSYEGVSRGQAIEQFREIIRFKKDNPEKVILLLGNHDCAYCYDFGDASRYDYMNEDTIKGLFKDNIDLFKLWHLGTGGCLFSHAGITNDWLKYSLVCNIQEFINGEYEEDLISHLWEVSFMRGGWNKTGSIIWSDVREGDRESTFYQIFGHTQLKQNPIITDKYACLDVRRCFLLDTETKKITESDGTEIVFHKDYSR